MRSPERCVECGSCVEVCPEGLCPDGMDPERCTGCFECVDACPTGARRMVGEWVTVDDALADVESDRVFYETSTGGVTFSGGEPLSQPRFLQSLLQESRSRGLSTCVDTCGFAPRRTLLGIAPLVDLFLYDLKTMDEERHLAYTGLALAPILGNLAALAAVHDNIWIRIPIVPGFTDDEAALERAAEMLEGMRGVRRVSLLPYHRQGSAKFARLGREYLLPDVMPPGADRMEALAEIFRRRGLDTHIGGEE